jgi:N-acetylneuraminate synthase
VSRTKIIAEVAQAHDGSLIDAHAYIRAVAAAGADAVKFQCHMPEFESSETEQFREGTFHPADVNRYHYWYRTQFTPPQWRGLTDHAHNLGLEFGASVFCSHAVALLADKVDWYKVPAGEWDNQRLINQLLATSQPIYWSLGMCGTLPDDLPEDLRDRITPLYTVSQYPAPPEAIDLDVISPGLGLSDHSGCALPALIAAYHRAPAVEVHVCWSKLQLAPDTESSITVDELRELVNCVRWVERLGTAPETQQQRAERHLAYRVGRRVA